MVILISGISSTGKTSMAQKLLEKYNFPYLSIDHLKMGLYRGKEDCGFTPTDSNELIGEKLWPVLKGIIMTNIENNQNLIIEGCYILPHHVNDIKPEYANEITSVFLGFSSNYIRENFESNIIGHRNAIETRGGQEERTMSDFIAEHNDFREKCLDLNVNYFEVDRDYEQEIKKVYHYLDKQKIKVEDDKAGNN
ncbi:2-phosphoglycerate kinase [Virgibacillus kekensis]|uniref:2-phosphoglycerate kinase n=1 Tax=Virgibacillus kekensis TaxID=202261 RepID=A0ABV9DIX3_9BACI